MSKKAKFVSSDDFWTGDGKLLDTSKPFVGKKTTGRCFESHQPLKLPNTELLIHGGSCITPSVLDADVYIGFDSGMPRTARAWPWKQGVEFLFKITDMHAPDSASEFTKLIDWTIKQLEAGKKVHCGCIGGHGRTGTFLAALSATLGEKDAIVYVRENYCKKAVESSAQIEFLAKNYGITKAPGSKSYGGYSSSSTGQRSISSPKAASPRKKVFDAMAGAGSVWGSFCN